MEKENREYKDSLFVDLFYSDESAVENPLSLLKRKGREVRNMLIGEYSYEDDIRVKQSEAWEEGRQEGRAMEIIDAGVDFGLSRQDILNRIMNKLNVSFQRAQEYFDIFEKQYADDH